VVDLSEEALRDALTNAKLQPEDVDHVIFVSITGLATPSIDARLVNRLGLRRDVKRTPIFGLGCVAGATGLARGTDYLRAFPQEVMALMSVELCSLTLQRSDVSFANLIASNLFNDGAAAAILVDTDRAEETNGADTPRYARPTVIASHSVFYRDSENV